MTKRRGNSEKFDARKKKKNLVKVQFYGCQEYGHYKRDCPNLKKENNKIGGEEAHTTKEVEEVEKKNSKKDEEEATWRLKSRAIWLKEGDKNTNFFHKFANSRREKNTIWRISDGKGGFYVSQHDISKEVVRHFKNQYKRREVCDFQDILWGIELAPQMFDDEKNESLFRPITEEEFLGVLKAFKKDKFPGPDG
eukprot:PITA_31081